MELFRKRFKVARWGKIYLSVLTDKKSERSETIQWITVLLAITLAYKPKLQFKLSYLMEKVLNPLKRYPTTFLFLIFSLISFLITTKLLTHNILLLEDLEFSLKADLWQWPLRTLSSEFIYFKFQPFIIFSGIIALVLFHIEKEVFDKKWASYILGLFVLTDIIVRLALGVMYKNILDSSFLFNLLNLFPTNGAAVLLASMSGFGVTLIGAKKDEWFAFSLLGLIFLSFISPAIGATSLAVLYSAIFFIAGYLVGKYYLNFQSQKDALINKNKNDGSSNISKVI